MIEFKEFFSESYWWLSLLGGIHCLGLGCYIRYIYSGNNTNHKLLGNIFNLIALYFFTGLLTNSNAPAPIHQLFTLIIPVYFLVMPLLYLYCYRSLHDINRPVGFSLHFYPALIITIFVVLTTGYQVLINHNWPNIGFSQQIDIKDMSLLDIALPTLLFIQTGIYFYYIIKMLNRYPSRTSHLHQDSLKDIKIRWLLVLTLALMSNWLIRGMVIILPLYFDEQAIMLNQAATRLTMLLTVYLLAIYGLNQITRAAYLRGKLAQQQSSINPMSACQQPLNSEETAYLQQLMQEDKQQRPKQTKAKTKQ